MKRRSNRPGKSGRRGRFTTSAVASAAVFTWATAAALMAGCPVTVTVTLATEPRTVVVGQTDVPVKNPVCPLARQISPR